MNLIKVLLNFVINGTSDVTGNRKIPRAIRAVIMLIYTIILTVFIVFLISSLMDTQDTITKVILGFLSAALAIIIVRGWRKVIKR
ncbi:MAG: hypothetical protein UIM53_02515 [Acutalibacteraceae bacterium]|nr:hypothetical protein [Acutalibacteraceae bacterium]